MVRLRLRRVGRKKQPSYRIVAADKESPRDGKFLEVVGFYNPRTEPETITLKEDRIYHWLGNGAQPSDAVARIFRTSGLDERFKRLKDGEELETLLQESTVWQDTHNVTNKTRVDTPTVKVKKAEAPVEEAPAVEAEAEEAPAEEPVEEAPAAEVEAEEEAPAEEAEEEAPAAEVEAEEEAPAEEAEEEAPAAEVEAEEEAPTEEAEAEEPAEAEEEDKEE